jgi:hypothetical protein
MHSIDISASTGMTNTAGTVIILVVVVVVTAALAIVGLSCRTIVIITNAD